MAMVKRDARVARPIAEMPVGLRQGAPKASPVDNWRL